MGYTNIIGIDNGVSGAIAFITNENQNFFLAKSYTKKCKSYTKIDQTITRIDVNLLKNLIKTNIKEEEYSKTLVILERPLVNPSRFKASMSAMRSLEATVIVFEELGIDVKYTDSKVWQHHFFTVEERVKEDTKSLSRKYGIIHFPQFKNIIEKQDADALLIGKYFYDSIVLGENKK